MSKELRNNTEEQYKVIRMLTELEQGTAEFITDMKPDSELPRNGSVVKILNIISDSRCCLSSLEYSFKGVDHYEFTDSIKYLYSSGYVELTDSENG